MRKYYFKLNNLFFFKNENINIIRNKNLLISTKVTIIIVNFIINLGNIDYWNKTYSIIKSQNLIYILLNKKIYIYI